MSRHDQEAVSGYIFYFVVDVPVYSKLCYENFEDLSRLEFTFDSYPRKSGTGVQDLNLFKSDVGSENACVKDKMRTFLVFSSCLVVLGSSIQNVSNLGFGGTNRMNSTLGTWFVLVLAEGRSRRNTKRSDWVGPRVLCWPLPLFGANALDKRMYLVPFGDIVCL